MTFKQGSNKVKQGLATTGKYLTASKKRQRITAVVVILACVGVGQIIIASFAATTEYSPIPAVAKMQKLTEEVITMTNDYAAMSDTVANKKGATQPNTLKANKKQELIAKVKERKEAYELAMKYDPQVTANAYLADAVRAKIPDEVKGVLEQRVEISGIWVNGINEARENVSEGIQAAQPSAQSLEGQPLNEDFVYIRNATNTDIHLYATALPRIKTGFVVKVKGVRVGNSLAVTRPKTEAGESVSIWSRLSPKAHAESVTETACQSSLGPIGGKICETIIEKVDKLNDDIFDQLIFCEDVDECRDNGDNINLTGDQGSRKTLVVPMNFKDDQVNPLTIEELDGSYKNLASIYDSMSYGKFKPQYDVYQKWTTISEDDNIVDCDATELPTVRQELSQATRATLDNDAELATKIVEGGYTDLMYVYNRLVCSSPEESMDTGGWAVIGRNRGEYLSESVILLTSVTRTEGRQWLVSAMAHELGHSYGLHHAHGACNDDAPTEDPEELDLSKYCTAEFAEYADAYNIMGRGQPLRDSMSFNFANKARLNWVSDADDAISVPAGGGQYTISALHKPSGKRALKLRYKDRDLYIEYRPITDEGTDRFVEGTMSSGLLTYFSNEDRSTSLLGSATLTGGGNTTWSYAAAGRLAPYRIGEGDDSICVISDAATVDSISVKISEASSCPKDEVKDYVYEKDLKIPLKPEEIAAWGSPQQLKVTNEDNLLLSGSGAGATLEMDKEGNKLAFSNPAAPGLLVDNQGNVYKGLTIPTSQYRHDTKLQKFDKTGAQVAEWLIPGQDVSIVDAVVDSSDNIYVLYLRRTNPAWTDFTVSQLARLDTDLNVIKNWELTNKYTGTGLALDKNKNIYAFEFGKYYHLGWEYQPESCVRSFTPNGDQLSRWCNKNSYTVNKYGDADTASGSMFGSFSGMKVDAKGNYLFAQKRYFPNISFFNNRNQYVGRIGNGRLAGNVVDFGVAKDGKLYVMDERAVNNTRSLKVFSPRVEPITYQPLRF